MNTNDFKSNVPFRNTEKEIKNGTIETIYYKILELVNK